MKTKNRILTFILSAVLMLAPFAALAENGGEAGYYTTGIPFVPGDLDYLDGITYTLHEDGVPGFTEETVAVLEVAPDAGASLLAGLPDYNYIQGYKTVEQIARSYAKNGHEVIAAINGGFFGTGNPPGTQVIIQGAFIKDGELLRRWDPLGTNDYISQEHYIVGTLKNGSFFHGHNPLHTMYIAIDGGEARELLGLNNPRSSGTPHWRDLNLITERFGETIPASPDRLGGVDVRLEVVSGRMAFGEELAMRVVQGALPAEADTQIGAGQAILTASNPGDVNYLRTLQPGDTVRVSHSVENRRGTAIDWAGVDQAVTAHFALIIAGKRQPLPGQPGALVPLYPEITPNPDTKSPLPLLPGQNIKRPRTAVGVRADGTMVWVVVSGSANTGMTMKEFQDYLMGQNLEYAWNFDGGGSSAMVVGETLVTYADGPDSPYQRPVANGFVLVNSPLPYGTFEITVQPRAQNAELVGGAISGSLTVKARSSVGELHFQWHQNGEPVGADSPVFDLPIDLAIGEHEFYVVVSAGELEPLVSDSVKIAVKFDDVEPGDWFFGDVMFAYENNLISELETAPMRFGPNAKLTRATLVAALYRHAGEPDVSGLENPFYDVEDGLWYSDAVIWAEANGVVRGFGEGRFAPGENITREQTAAIMVRYADATGKSFSGEIESDGFADDELISDWAMEAVKTIHRAGIIFGKPGNLFDPKNSVTRAEASAILRRFAEM